MLALILGLAAAYFLLGRLTFAFDARPGNITSVPFFPEGVSLWMFIRYGPRMWPGVFLGQWLLAISTGISVEASALVGAMNASEGLLGGVLFGALRISPDLAAPRDIVRFVGMSAFVLQPLSATGGVFSQDLLDGLDDVGLAWVYWWLGNTLGQVLAAAPLLVWTSPGRRPRRRELRAGIVVASGCVIVVSALLIPDWLSDPAPIRFVCFGGFFAVLTWISVRSEVATVTLCNLIAAGGLLSLANVRSDLLTLLATSVGATGALIVSSLIGQLRSAAAELRRVNQAQARVFEVIGHDLRGPIHAAGLLLESLGSGQIPAAEIPEVTAPVSTDIRRMARTLDGLVEWGRAEMDARGPRPEPVVAREIVAAACDDVASRASAKTIALRNEVAANVVVQVDPVHLQSIVRNLLANAVKFTPRGGRVEVTASRHGARWEISVSDTGPGIDAAQAKLLLGDDPAGSTPGTDGEHGSGVGLQIARTFAEANHGEITIASAPGQGTTVAVRLRQSAA